MKNKVSITVRILTVLIGLIGIFVSLPILFIEIMESRGGFFADERIIAIFGIFFSIIYLLSNVGIIMRMKKAVKINLFVVFPFILLGSYFNIIIPRNLWSEYITLNLLGRIAFRWGSTVWTLVMFSVYYIPSIVFLNHPKVRERFK